VKLQQNQAPDASHLGLEMGALGLWEKWNKLGPKGAMLVAVHICMSVPTTAQVHFYDVTAG